MRNCCPLSSEEKNLHDTEMVERIAEVLRIEPYRLFKDPTKTGSDSDEGKIYPLLPKIMKNEIQNQIHTSINEIFDKY